MRTDFLLSRYTPAGWWLVQSSVDGVSGIEVRLEWIVDGTGWRWGRRDDKGVALGETLL